MKFFPAQVCDWNSTVSRTFGMILDARKTSAQRRYNESKIVENVSRSSELRADEGHHAEGIFKSEKSPIISKVENSFDIMLFAGSHLRAQRSVFNNFGLVGTALSRRFTSI